MTLQNTPYGIYDNHIKKYIIKESSTKLPYLPTSGIEQIENQNEIFNNYAEYQTYLSQNPDIEQY
ncbi:MAG: hypothetical protein ACLFN8_05150 [Candidatus Woesearchaeota archaeon]